MNIQIETFKQNLYNVINASQLPIGIVKLIMQNTLLNINDLYNQMLIQQSQQDQSTQQTNQSNTSQTSE